MNLFSPICITEDNSSKFLCLQEITPKILYAFLTFITRLSPSTNMNQEVCLLLIPDSLYWLNFMCTIQWVLQIMLPSACSFIVCWFSLPLTTCFGLHGHLQVCRSLHIFKESASLLFGSLPFFSTAVFSDF
jgi:hypothetical protein